MNLEGILHVSGKAGLFKIVSKGKNTIIAESLSDGKRSPIYSHVQANMLEEIGIYTYDDTKPLSEIFDEIAKKENTKPTISHKSSKEDLISYFKKILPNYDEERVYISDIKKVIQWYNSMQRVGLIKLPKKDKDTNKK
tara:strand:+ start:128 stop:541 length:414 start_codon:yes stop_codon:yes gene_type:complete